MKMFSYYQLNILVDILKRTPTLNGLPLSNCRWSQRTFMSTSIPSIPSGASLYTQGTGSASSNNLNNVIRATRDPTTSDTKGPSGNFGIGQRWVNYSSNNTWTLTSLGSASNLVTATWTQEGAGTGALNELLGDSGTANPSAGAITIAGGAGITTSATGSTVTVALAGGSVAMDSFVPDAGTNPVVPTASGTVTMAGTGNQITTTGGTNTLTFSVPSAFVAPGSIASTTTVTAGTGLTVTTGNLAVSAGNATVTGNVVASKSAAGATVSVQATNSDNTSGTSKSGVEIATGGASSGDPYLSFQISGVGASTMTMGLDNSASDLFVVSNSTALGTSNALTLSQAGALTATTSITATLGAITATNGNVVLGTAGNKLMSTSVASDTPAAGANSFGTVTLGGGTANVSTTAVTASSLIFLTRMSVGATGANDLGMLTVGTISAGASFVINAWTVTNATALQGDDVSLVGWMIVN